MKDGRGADLEGHGVPGRSDLPRHRAAGVGGMAGWGFMSKGLKVALSS